VNAGGLGYPSASPTRRRAPGGHKGMVGLPSIYAQPSSGKKQSRKEIISMMDHPSGEHPSDWESYPYDKGHLAQRPTPLATDPEGMYQEMKDILMRWEASDPEEGSARERAYFGSLRHLLHDCVRSGRQGVREERTRAAYKWYLKSSIPTGFMEAPTSEVQQRWMAIVSIHNNTSPSAAVVKRGANLGKRTDFMSVFSKLADSPLATDKVKYLQVGGIP